MWARLLRNRRFGSLTLSDLLQSIVIHGRLLRKRRRPTCQPLCELKAMSNYESVLSAAAQLPVDDRLRLIDELASSMPDDQPPQLSDAWLREIDRRSNEIDSGAVVTEDWADIRARLFAKHGVDGAN
ncbi:MAG TPA: hypothetical protein EYQ75_14705 [Planctomycetaceae bacterium]|nr:hypothetical protein [Planctomycetaceae bacterium]